MQPVILYSLSPQNTPYPSSLCLSVSIFNLSNLWHILCAHPRTTYTIPRSFSFTTLSHNCLYSCQLSSFTTPLLFINLFFHTFSWTSSFYKPISRLLSSDLHVLIKYWYFVRYCWCCGERFSVFYCGYFCCCLMKFRQLIRLKQRLHPTFW